MGSRTNSSSPVNSEADTITPYARRARRWLRLDSTKLFPTPESVARRSGNTKLPLRHRRLESCTYTRTIHVQSLAMAHEHELPVLVDAAGELPPRSNLKGIPATGADLVSFSGGKAIRGPQSTGILCGRRALISSAALQMLDMDDHPELWYPPEELIDRSQFTGIPRHGIGRGLKVSKEEIVALLTALDLFDSGKFDRQLIGFRRLLQTVADSLSQARADCRMVEPSTHDRWPVLEITVDSSTLGRSAMDVCRALRTGTPPVYVGHVGLREGIVQINPVCLTDAVTPVLITRLLAELS